MTPARWIAIVVLIVAAVFAWTGGTFSASNYMALKRDEVAAREELRQLKRAVDSLQAFRDSLTSDVAVQERVARDELGMLRPGELTFTIIPDSGRPDSARRKAP